MKKALLLCTFAALSAGVFAQGQQTAKKAEAAPAKKEVKTEAKATKKPVSKAHTEKKAETNTMKK